jgi:hypothetical protein
VFEFTLNYDLPEQNYGYFITRVSNVTVGDERMDILMIIKPLFDPRDIKNDTKFTAMLLPNRTGMYITEPSVPYYMSESVAAMEQAERNYLEGNETMCAASVLEYRTQIAALGKSESRKSKTTIIRFPNNIKGNNTYLNKPNPKKTKSASKYDLATNSRFILQQMEVGTDKLLNFCAPYAYWKIVIEGTIRTTDVKPPTTTDDLFVNAMKGMNINK